MCNIEKKNIQSKITLFILLVHIISINHSKHFDLKSCDQHKCSHLIPDCFSQTQQTSFCQITNVNHHANGIKCGWMYDRGDRVERASELRRKLQSFRKKQRHREGNSEWQTETCTLSPSSQAHAGGFSRRTTRPSRPWGSTETVPLCTDKAGGDSCRPPLRGKRATDHDAILHTKNAL